MSAPDPKAAPPVALPVFHPGHVWLAGAGPGDPGLLTLLAYHALKTADVIVYDALVDKAVLELAGPDARLDYAGKRGGKPSPSQPDITRKMIEHARQGLRVLRLKGGDPFVFGRGAEEALALAEAGIPFRIVPGITAGIGGLAYAGIPATARCTNAAVALITGHDAEGSVPGALDWDRLAALPVLVFYMAMTHLPEICARLLAAGRDPGTPAALVSHAATPAQRVVEGCLADIAERARGAEPPALVVFGEVVSLRRRLAWFEPGTKA